MSVETSNPDENRWKDRYDHYNRYDWRDRHNRKNYHTQRHPMHWVQIDPLKDEEDSQKESRSFIIIRKGANDRHGSAIKF